MPNKTKSSQSTVFRGALEASEVRYRRLFETAKDGILILDADSGKIIDSNPFLEALLGYSHSELIGKKLWEIGPFRDVVASQAAFKQLQAKEYVRYENLPLETKSGERRDVEFVSNVYLVDEHAVIQCNVRDITARKAAENAVLKSNQNLVLMVSELQRRDREMSLLNHMNDLLQPCTVLAEAYHVVALVAAELFDGPEGCLAILHHGQDQLESVVRWGSQVTIESRFPLNDCWAMRRGRLHEVNHPESGLLCRHFNSTPKTAYWCVPLMVQGETLGVVCVICPPGRTPEREASDQQLAVTVGETIKLSLSNLRLREELREQATHDPLTGLYNRRYMDDSLIREIYGAQRRDSELCVAMLDLDHFKEFNDSFGHDAGDSLLKEFGRVLRETMRKSDIAFRTGGEEFLLVFPDCSAADTALRVEQVRQHVRALQIRQGEQPLGTATVSAGVAAASVTGWTATELLRAADEALYSAKQRGRDRVVVYQAPVPRSPEPRAALEPTKPTPRVPVLRAPERTDS